MRSAPLAPLTLRGPTAAWDPFFSPDGEWVAYQAGPGGPLQRVSISGGPPLTITALSGDLRGGSWGPDGTIVFALADFEGLYRVSATGGTPTSLTDPGGSVHFYPDVLPNGVGVLFEVNTSASSTTDDQIAVLDLRTGEHRVIIEQGTSPRYVSSGHMLYAVGSTLMAVAFDDERLAVTSEPVPVVEGVMVTIDGPANFSLSETGSLLYVRGDAVGTLGPRTAVWVDREGREEPLPLPPREYTQPRVSPDGTQLAVAVVEASGANALWVYDVVSAAGLRLTQEASVNTPVWAPDGRLIFSSTAEGPNQIHAVMADGSGPPQGLLSNDMVVGDYPTSVTPDGRNVVFSRIVTGTQREIWQLPLEGDTTPEPLLQGEFDRGNGEVSPDGRWLVYRSNQSGQMEVYVQPYPGPGPTVPVSIGGGHSVTWSPDGSELIYRLDDRVMAAPFSVDGRLPRVGRPIELFRGDYVAAVSNGARQYHVAPDGRFLMLKAAPGEGADDELPPQVVLVQNFFEELKPLAPS